MAGYTRQSTASIINGSNITAPPLNAEFNQVAAAFNAASGHGHTGGTGDAPKIPLSTSVSGYLPAVHGGTGGKNKFDATSTPAVTNDGTEGYAPGSMWENTTTGRIYVCVGNSTGAAVWRELVQVTSGNAILPAATDTVDLGDNNTRFQDLFLSGGIAAFGNASLGGTLNVTSNTGVGGTLVVTGATTLAATSATSLNVSGTSTLSTVDINNGNIDNTQIGAANPSTGAFTSLTASGTSTLTTVDINNGNIDNTVIGGTSAAPASFTTINATGNITGNLVGNVTGNITASGSSTLNNLTVNGTMDVTNTQIANVSTPTNASHAANKSYVDAQINNLIGGAPSTLDTLNEIADALNDDANVYNTLDTKIDTKLSKAGDTMSGDLAMGANKVTGLATPTTGTDAVNLTYVTNLFGSTSSAASSASAASTSESNAASSATAAAASYDSFDDRYIGPKTGTLPSVDNDGNALVVGALVFDATNNVMKVWNGSEFQAASSSIDGIKSNFKYTATANQTSFLGADANGNTLVIDNADLVNVFMNGVRLIGGGSDYTASANVNTVTLTTGATASDVIEIEVFGNFTGQAGSAVSITGGTVSGLTSLGVAGNATFGDDNKAIFGTNSELEIFSNGTQALVKSNAGHDLILRSNDTIKLERTTGSTSMIEAVADGAVNLFHAGTQRLATSSSGASITGSLGINISSPAYPLVVQGPNPRIQLLGTGTNTGISGLLFGDADTATRGQINYNHSSDSLDVVVNAQEAMRLSSDGTLLVGKTSSDTNAVGVELGATGYGAFCRDANKVGIFNRKTNNGTILDFKKDGTSVGSVGVHSDDQLFISRVTGSQGIKFKNDGAIPCNSSGSDSDADQDLGISTARWRDLYLSGGVYLGGTGSANKLDDVETGTWVPTIGTGTVRALDCRYTKIGNLVHLRGYFDQWSNQTSGNNLTITGLPFAPVSSLEGGSFNVMVRYLSFDDGISGYINANNTLSFYSLTSNGNYAIRLHSHLNNTTANIRINAFYETAS